MRLIVSEAVSNSYFAGLEEGGVTPDEFTEEDAATVDGLIYDQFEHIGGFVQFVLGACDNLEAAYDRTDLWVVSIQAAGQAGLNSAKQNEMVVFGGIDGEESCNDCQRFKTEAHRRKWFVAHNYLPATPGSALACSGWLCQHELVAVRP